MADPESIDISKLDKAEVLCALYDRARQQGLGLLNPRGREPLGKEEAAGLLQQGTRFGYLAGRVLKVDLGCDALDPWLYDLNNGHGAAREALAPLLERMSKEKAA